MTKNPDQTFARRLREERNRAGISQAELGRRLTNEFGHTIDHSAVSRAERGTRTVPFDEAVALADLLDIPIDGMTRDSIKAEARVLRVRQDLRRAQRHADDTQGELQQALVKVTAIKHELSKAKLARRP